MDRAHPADTSPVLVYGPTSLPAERAGLEQLLDYVRTCSESRPLAHGQGFIVWPGH
jgi:hypothetical protein